jgi:hypothetical protein
VIYFRNTYSTGRAWRLSWKCNNDEKHYATSYIDSQLYPKIQHLMHVLISECSIYSTMNYLNYELNLINGLQYKMIFSR